ncbi:MAG: hypothetical protein ACP5JP_10835, partial [bacterium]
MKKIDGRKQKKEVQQQIRELIIRNKRLGKTRREISESLGISGALIDKVWKLYREKGKKGIKLRKRGKPSEKKLSQEQERLI